MASDEKGLGLSAVSPSAIDTGPFVYDVGQRLLSERRQGEQRECEVGGAHGPIHAPKCVYAVLLPCLKVIERRQLRNGVCQYYVHYAMANRRSVMKPWVLRPVRSAKIRVALRWQA